MQEELRLRVTGQRPLKKRLWGLSSRILFARCRVQRLEAYEALGEALKRKGQHALGKGLRQFTVRGLRQTA